MGFNRSNLTGQRSDIGACAREKRIDRMIWTSGLVYERIIEAHQTKCQLLVSVNRGIICVHMFHFYLLWVHVIFWLPASLFTWLCLLLDYCLIFDIFVYIAKVPFPGCLFTPPVSQFRWFICSHDHHCYGVFAHVTTVSLPLCSSKQLPYQPRWDIYIIHSTHVSSHYFTSQLYNISYRTIQHYFGNPTILCEFQTVRILDYIIIIITQYDIQGILDFILCNNFGNIDVIFYT